MKYFSIVGLCTIITLASPLHGELQLSTSPGTEGHAVPAPQEIPNAIHLIGVPDLRPETSGKLSLTQEALEFATTDIRAKIPYKHIVAVFVGTERTEAAGKAGYIARKMPYGAGPVFALASQKQVDLLTVEFQDTHGGYHGTVFVLPVNSGAAFQSAISRRIPPPPQFRETPACAAGTPVPHTVELASVKVEGVEIPAEYRVLLYEHVMHLLSKTDSTNRYLRPGDHSPTAECAAFRLHITATCFNKGNQSLRAATGPLGMFIGATSITLRLTLDDAHGVVVLNQDIKRSKRGDSDSLNLARDIATDISKRIDKEMKKTHSTGQLS